MGKKQTHLSRQSEENSSLICESHSTSQEFYRKFRKHFNDDDLREFNTIFQRINIAFENVSTCLYKFMGTKSFQKNFKEELEGLQSKSNQVQKAGQNIRQCFMKHCFAVLIMYIEITENIYDANSLNRILTRIATSHGFVTNIRDNFRIHDSLLQKFMKDEFSKYTTKPTFKSLQKYMSLISERIISLAEYHNKNMNLNNTIKMLNHQKAIINTKLNKRASLSEVYVNQSTDNSSDYGLLKAEYVAFPGTSSKASGQKLDKKSKLKRAEEKHKF